MDLVLITVALQANRNRLLDVARETYKENIGDIYHLNRMLSEEHDLPLMMVYQDTGFVFALRKTDLEGELPKVFVNVVLRKGRWMFSSMELVCFLPFVRSFSFMSHCRRR
jgi:DNA mismatch repair protein MSH4